MPAALGPCSRLGIQSAQGIRRGSCAAFAPADFTHRHDYSFRSQRAGRVRRGCRIAGIAAASASALTLATSAFMFRFVLDTQTPLSMMKPVRAGKVPGTKLEGVRRDAAEEARAALVDGRPIRQQCASRMSRKARPAGPFTGCGGRTEREIRVEIAEIRNSPCEIAVFRAQNGDFARGIAQNGYFNP